MSLAEVATPQEVSKHANKRSPAKREEDYSTIASLYAKGQSQAAIAEKLGLSRQQISFDLKKIQQRWRDASLRDFDERKAEELAKIDHLEREYWSAWADSKGTHKVTSVKSKRGPRTIREISVHSEDQVGDPRFLQGVERCIEQRCKIFGVYAPLKIDVREVDEMLANEIERVLGEKIQPDSTPLSSEAVN